MQRICYRSQNTHAREGSRWEPTRKRVTEAVCDNFGKSAEAGTNAQLLCKNRTERPPVAQMAVGTTSDALPTAGRCRG